VHLDILTQYYPPAIGASQRRISHLEGRFVQAGHSVTVLAGMPNYPQGKIVPGYGIVFPLQLAVMEEQNSSSIRHQNLPVLDHFCSLSFAEKLDEERVLGC
jgi:hypothetical protein